MNCFNGEAYLREAIDSVFAQTYRAWEIIFYDNCSSDNSKQIAQSYDARLKYCCGSQTIPLGAARNQAISNARGDFIAFLDADDLWLPRKLEDQVALMKEHPEVALVYSNAYALKMKSGQKQLINKLMQPSGDVFSKQLKHYTINLQTVMVRKEAFSSMEELFDPTLEVSEEYDVFIRLLYKSKAIYLDQATAIYRVHSQMTSARKKGLFPIENERILEKLRCAIPKFDETYAEELLYLRAKIAYWYATTYMSEGDKVRARDLLRPHKFVALTFTVLFALTFFPKFIWNYLISKRTVLGVT